MTVVVGLTGRVDADDRVELRVSGLDLDGPRRLPVVERRHAGDGERLLAGQAQGLGGLPLRELQREDAHADEVRAVDPLVGLRDDGPDAQQRRPLAAQSREDPEPYSLPASTTSGVPAASSSEAS